MAVLTIHGEAPKCIEKIGIGDSSGTEVRRLVQVEEIAVERWNAENATVVFGMEEREGGLEAAPQIHITVACVVVLAKDAQAADAIPLAVNGVFSEQVPLFRDHEKEKAIDQAQEFFVKCLSSDLAGEGALADIRVTRVNEDRISERWNGTFDAFA